MALFNAGIDFEGDSGNFIRPCGACLSGDPGNSQRRGLIPFMSLPAMRTQPRGAPALDGETLARRKVRLCFLWALKPSGYLRKS